MTPRELQSARLNRGLSLRQAAKQIGVPEQSIRRLEAGQGVYPANAKKIADFYGVQVTDLQPFETAA